MLGAKEGRALGCQLGATFGELVRLIDGAVLGNRLPRSVGFVGGLSLG